MTLDRGDAANVFARAQKQIEIASRRSGDDQGRPHELPRTAYRVIVEFLDRTISDETFDPPLVYRIGQALGRKPRSRRPELRAKVAAPAGAVRPAKAAGPPQGAD